MRWQTLREIGAAGGVAVPGGPDTGGPVFERGFRQFADHNALVRAAADASFAPAATKARLHAEIDAWLATPAG